MLDHIKDLRADEFPPFVDFQLTRLHKSCGRLRMKVTRYLKLHGIPPTTTMLAGIRDKKARDLLPTHHYFQWAEIHGYVKRYETVTNHICLIPPKVDDPNEISEAIARLESILITKERPPEVPLRAFKKRTKGDQKSPGRPQGSKNKSSLRETLRHRELMLAIESERLRHERDLFRERVKKFEDRERSIEIKRMRVKRKKV